MGTFFLLYNRGYTGTSHCPAAPAQLGTAIQLYSAIHYTAIQRYTVYKLYIIPLDAPVIDASEMYTCNKAARHSCDHLQAHKLPICRLVSTVDIGRPKFTLVFLWN